MSQDNYFNQLKQWFIKYKNKLFAFYHNYIKIPCINLYNYIFIKKIDNPIEILTENDLSNNDIELDNITNNTIDTTEQSITKRISYSDSNDFQEISIHRHSISSCVNSNYLDKNE